MATRSRPANGPRPAVVTVIAKRGGGGDPLRRYVGRQLRKALQHLPHNGLQRVSVALVGDALMSRLHAESHGDPTPTDVLTYELERNGRGVVTEGEIVVCVPEARRRAGRHSISVRREVLLYALHGVLHLCGLDDRTAREFARMHTLEDDILAKIGVGRVFYGSGAHGSGNGSRR